MDLESIVPQISGLPERDKAELLKLIEEYEEAKAIKAAREDFLCFVRMMWPGFIDGRHHKQMSDAFQRVLSGVSKRVIINMPPRHELSVTTPIMTSSGWKTMGTVESGDFVFAPDGCPVRVVGKSEVHRKRLYEVETTDGHIIECDEGHLWRVTAQCKSMDRCWRTMEAGEILARGFRHGPYIPDWTAVAPPEAELPIHPYVLGVWLGDGTKYGACIGCGREDESEMRRLVEVCGYETSDRNGYQMFGILGLHRQLREEGLIENKHIPDAYFASSIEQREALLQGLMDTDGSVGASGRCTFHQTDRGLAEQVQALVCSLGVKARISTRQTSYNGRPSKLSYRVNFRHPRAARLSRKMERLGDWSKNRGRSIKVRKTERYGDVQCLQVENEDGLFLAGRGFVATHNTKSEFASIHLPAYFLGLAPDKKIIQATHTSELAVGFGRKVRSLVGGEDFQRIFPGVDLSADSKAAGRWSTNKKGEYFAIGVGGAVAGRGADLLVIDDPIDEQTAQYGEYNPEVYDKIWDWYTLLRQRLQPGGSIIVVMTRWSKRDITGRLIKQMTEENGTDEWEVIQLPAVMPSGEPLWPEYWSLDELMKTKASIPVSRWMAQYQQMPTSEEGALIKRDWWRKWEATKPPKVDGIIMSWDTAFEKTQRADYSACTIWGVWHNEKEDADQLMLLHAFKDKWEFPELKTEAKKAYMDWEPDMVVIEKKASGAPLIYELRQMGIPVQEYTPTRGNDKISRVNSITDIFASNMVWAPETRWAEEVIEECAEFPAGDHDDYVDSCLAGDTMIFTASGLKEISSVAVGDRVMTHRGRFRRVTAVSKRTANDLMRVKSASLDEIGITPEHPVYSSRVNCNRKAKSPVWIPASELVPTKHREGRRGKLETTRNACSALTIPVLEDRHSNDDFDLRSWVNVPDPWVPKEDTIHFYSNHGRCNRVLKKLTFGYEAGWLMGMFAAEGCWSRRAAHWSQSEKNSDNADRIIDGIRRVFGIEPRVYHSNGMMKIVLFCSILGPLFEEFGRHAENKRVPAWAFDCSREFRLGFIDGVVSGDGHYYSKRNHTIITSSSRSLLWGVRLLLLAEGVPSSITAGTGPGPGRLQKKPSWCLLWGGKRSDAILTEKAAAYVVRRKTEPTETAAVFNLEVDEDESYLTTGGVVHNCAMALLRFRQGGFIRLGRDDDDDDPLLYRRRRAEYY